MSILRDAVRQKVISKIGAKTRVDLRSDHLNTAHLRAIGEYLGTKSTKTIVETAFIITAVKYLDKSGALFEQLSYDKMSPLLSALSATNSKPGKLRVRIHVLRWALLAVSRDTDLAESLATRKPEKIVNQVLTICRETLDRSLRF